MQSRFFAFLLKKQLLPVLAQYLIVYTRSRLSRSKTGMMKVTSQRKLPTPSWRGLCRFIGERPTPSERLTPRALSTVGSLPISGPVRTGSLRCVRACVRTYGVPRKLRLYAGRCCCLLVFAMDLAFRRVYCHGYCSVSQSTVRRHKYVVSRVIKTGVRRTHVYPPSL